MYSLADNQYQMSALYGNLIGVIFMSTCLLAYAGAIKLAKKFLQVGIGI